MGRFDHHEFIKVERLDEFISNAPIPRENLIKCFQLLLKMEFEDEEA